MKSKIQQYLQQLIEYHWYNKQLWWLNVILWPLSYIFLLISKLRYYCYHHKIFKSYKLKCPVIIVGNISVGGVGKTPVTKYLVEELQKLGVAVGVILRGYKGNATHATIVNKNSDNIVVGDEALIYATNNIPTAIGRNRYLAGVELLKAYPDLQIIISDDGLQHYKLRRDYEIVIIDPLRIYKNLYVLPMGPLREPITRIKNVNAVIINNATKIDSKIQLNNNALINLINNIKTSLHKPHIAHQTFNLEKIFNLNNNKTATPEFFQNKKIIAMAGIGNPDKFFTYINDVLLISTTKNIAFPDHHHYTTQDINEYLNNADAVLITEKDYTKIVNLVINSDKIWVVIVKAILNDSTIINDIVQLI